MPGSRAATPSDGHDPDPAEFAAWERGELPAVREVASGMWSIPVPCAMFPVRFTYSHVLIDGAEAVVVDPGLDSPAGVEAMSRGLQRAGLGMRELTGVIVTHSHPDHLGMAGRLHRESGAWIAAHEVEAARIVDDLADEVAEQQWQAAAGIEPRRDAADAPRLAAMRDFVRTQSWVPDRPLRDGEDVSIGSRALRVVHTPGHTSGHICLIDRHRRILLSGDHVLPRINPNVGLHPGMLDEDPLRDFLESLDRLRPLGDVLVRPAHEYGFTGLTRRLDALSASYRARTGDILSVLRGGGARSPREIAPDVSWSRAWGEMGLGDRRLAVATTFAHLRYLEREGLVTARAHTPVRFEVAA